MALNKAIIQGNLADEIKVGKTQGGLSFAFFTVAVNEYRGKDNERATHWLPCVVYGKLAETLAHHTKKGQELILEAKQTTQSLKLDDGYSKNFVTNVVEAFHFVRTPTAVAQESVPEGAESPNIENVDDDDYSMPDGF